MPHAGFNIQCIKFLMNVSKTTSLHGGSKVNQVNLRSIDVGRTLKAQAMNELS